MQQEYYSLPLNLEAVMQKREHPKCSLQQSVVQQLHLVITTAFGELQTDDSFGCSIWDNDFDNLTSGPRLKEIIRQSLLQSISQHEPRLAGTRVELQVEQQELQEEAFGRRVKKRMDVTVSAMLIHTNEPFAYKDSFYIGPLSY